MLEKRNMSVPEVSKISDLITALKLQVEKRTCVCDYVRLQYLFDLPAWDRSDWLRLSDDEEMLDFLMSGSPQSDRLVRSLRSFVLWHAAAEINELHTYVGRVN